MIRSNSEISKEERFAAWLFAPAVRLDGYKNGIDLGQSLGIIQLQNPALLGSIVLIEDAQIEGVFPIRAAAPPGLKGLSMLAFLPIKIVSVEDQRLILRIEQATIGPARDPLLVGVIDLRDVQIARPHDLTNVAIMRKQLFLLAEGRVAILEQLCEFRNFVFQGLGVRSFFARLLLKGSHLLLQRLGFHLRGLELLSQVSSLAGEIFLPRLAIA